MYCLFYRNLGIQRTPSYGHYSDSKYIHDIDLLYVHFTKLDSEVRQVVVDFYPSLTLIPCFRNDKLDQDEGWGDRYQNQLVGYLQLKIIEAQINTCFRKRFLSGIFFVFGVCNSLCSYFCVLHSESMLHHVENLVFPCALVETVFFILFVVGLCGMLNKKSEITLNQLKFGSLDRVLDRKLFCKRVRACPQIKVRFGSNFVDVQTPLRMMVLCIKGTVRLLLLK